MQAVEHVLDQATMNAPLAKKDYCKLVLMEFVNATVQFIVNYQENNVFASQVFSAIIFIFFKVIRKEMINASLVIQLGIRLVS